MLLAELLHMGDKFHGAGCHKMNIDDFPLGDIDVYGRIHVDEVIAGKNCCLE